MRLRKIITLNNVVKKYILHHEKPTLVEQLIYRRNTEEFTALDNISLDIFYGEKIGIIGLNGSGKTTLLKIISGISTPTKGTIQTFGKVVSLIDLSAGFHPDLAGYDNIYLNGLLLGMSKRELKEKVQDIIKFADIGRFIDIPLYTYSSGMKLRLGFSIAVHANPDILLLDEGVNVGDKDFYQKGGKKINELFKAKKTIIVVTHDLGFIRKYCRKVIWMENGRIRKEDGIKLLDEYKNSKQ